MPCYDGRENERQVLVNDVDRERLRKAWRHNSDVAELLCTVLKGTPKATLAKMPREVQMWWKEHQERDAKRAVVRKANRNINL